MADVRSTERREEDEYLSGNYVTECVRISYNSISRSASQYSSNTEHSEQREASAT
jgi:hypothetical protein